MIPQTSPEITLTIYIVDDDAAVRDSLSLMLGLLGYRTASFSSAEAFLDASESLGAGCLIADLRMPGMSGLELQQELKRRGSGLPVVMLTGHGDVKSARSAFQAEAVDFLEKPVDEAELRKAVETALNRQAARIRGQESAAVLSSLTPRETEVLAQVSRGLPAKEISVLLGISPRTVEVHKARIMEKVGARNVAELVRIVVTLEKVDAA
jgi:FixJ family two-component response regulator